MAPSPGSDKSPVRLPGAAQIFVGQAESLVVLSDRAIALKNEQAYLDMKEYDPIVYLFLIKSPAFLMNKKTHSLEGLRTLCNRWTTSTLLREIIHVTRSFSAQWTVTQTLWENRIDFSAYERYSNFHTVSVTHMQRTYQALRSMPCMIVSAPLPIQYTFLAEKKYTAQVIHVYVRDIIHLPATLGHSHTVSIHCSDWYWSWDLRSWLPHALSTRHPGQPDRTYQAKLTSPG